MIGILYFVFRRWFKKADVVFAIVFGLLAIFCVWEAAQAHMGTPVLTSEFRTLLIGIIIIMAIGVELIPFLFHNKKFEDAVI